MNIQDLEKIEKCDLAIIDLEASIDFNKGNITLVQIYIPSINEIYLLQFDDDHQLLLQ